jgi:hypothetical protein
MRRYTSPRTSARKTLKVTAACLVFITTAIAGTLIYQFASSSAPSLDDVVSGDRDSTTTADTGGNDRRGAPGRQAGDHGGTATQDDGLLPDGVTVFDDAYPGVANLAPNLLQALREAATDAAYDDIEFYVTSGWRSPEYQNQLLREAVAEYGSEAEAARWVATADTSAHVSGDAVDIGPADASAWLSEHGAAYGLCQIYGNEPWHYELRPQAIDGGCPPLYADPTHDPRMQQ